MAGPCSRRAPAGPGDIALARKVSDRMAVMYKGRIVEEGLTNEILVHPLHPYTRRLVDCASGRYEKENDEIEMVEKTVAMEKYC
jgi:ABC-type dipeptide/oligopeptide/nickel transport system ATPase component